MPYKDPEVAKARRKTYYAEHRAGAIQRAKEWRLANPEAYRANMKAAYDRRKGDAEFLEKRRQWTLAWRAANPSKPIEYRNRDDVKAANYEATRAFQEKHPEQSRASKKLCYAVKTGKLTRPDKCENCGGGGPIEGAHHDYERPLDVRWLCRSCHRSWDKREPKLSV